MSAIAEKGTGREKGTLPFFQERGVSPFLGLSPFLAVLCLATAAYAADSVKLNVDLTSAPQHMLHATMRIPAKPGPMTLRYPKWLPGEHGPTGPIKDVTGMFVKANGKDIGWKRDPRDMFAFRVEVPAGASELAVSLDLLIPTATEGFSSGASATSQLALLSWNQVVLYPAEAKGNAIDYEATITLPPGWKFGTALPVKSAQLPIVTFAPVSLTTLVDSPVLTGESFKTIVLDDRPGRRVVIDVAADAAADLEMPVELENHYKQLVKEADALFAARHFGAYHFLLSLSDHVAHFGLEHHESSDDRARERSLVDPDKRLLMMNLLPHEYTHSWNGKFRRPAELMPDDFAAPVDSSLLWVYEGLTQYLGWVLAGRSGLRTVPEELDNLALTTAELDHRGGREWRSLEDTATAGQLLYETDPPWQSLRRRTDFYDEGTLIWLEADVTIRKLTRGAKSLDDFCKRFHGGGTGAPEVKTYVFSDVVAALNAIAPYDWAGFLNERILRRGGGAPLGGIEGGGWRLTFAETRSPTLKSLETVTDLVDTRYSLGLLLEKSGKVVDVPTDSPAWTAGVRPGMTLLAVNGRKFGPDVLRDAIHATKASPGRVTLILENDDFFRELPVSLDGGERYPVLTRKQDGEDVIGAILAPKAETPYNNPPAANKR
jgi:predicted metalloprotease with PDZ domain